MVNFSSTSNYILYIGVSMEFNRKIYIMPNRFFTGDPHHNHKNVVLYDNAPFETIEERDIAIIFKHNDMVKPDDITYCLGDFYFRGGKEGGKKHYWEYLKQYNGRYVIIKGNHDRNNSIIDSIQSCSMYISGVKIFCVHDPINSKVEYDLNLVAHVHNAWKMAELRVGERKTLLINVGVTQWDYRPVPWRNLYELYEQWRVGKIKAQVYDKVAVQKIREERRIQRKENLRG